VLQEVEQMKRMNARREDEMMQRHMLEKKRLPKILKNEMKTRQLMFKQSLRISGITTVDHEREKIKQVLNATASVIEEIVDTLIPSHL